MLCRREASSATTFELNWPEDAWPGNGVVRIRVVLGGSERSIRPAGVLAVGRTGGALAAAAAVAKALAVIRLPELRGGIDDGMLGGAPPATGTREESGGRTSPTGILADE